jgi:predicted dinucleotide-binding enzyme
VIGHTSSGAQALAKRVANAHVVFAFNTVLSEVLFGAYKAMHIAKELPQNSSAT